MAGTVGMNVYPLRLYGALFITQILAVFALRMVQSGLLEAVLELPFFAAILGTTLYLGSRYAFSDLQKALDIQKIPLSIGLALFIPSMMLGTLFSALLLLGFFMLAGFNVTLNTGKQMAYVLIATFVAFLYATSESHSSLFLAVAIAFIFAFVGVLVQDYFVSRTRKDQRAFESYGGLGIGISMVVLLFATLLYLFVPRLEAINLGFLYAGGGTYYKDKALERQAERQQGKDVEPTHYPDAKPNSDAHALEPSGGGISNALMFYVRSADPVYLRGSVYDRFDGTQWVQTLASMQSMKLKEGKLTLGDMTQNNADARVTVMHTEYAPKDKIIYIPPSPYEIEFPGSVISRDAYATYYAPKVIEAKSFYSAQRSKNGLDSRAVLAQADLYQEAAYLQIPKGVTPRLYPLVDEIVANAKTPYEKAVALESYLRTNYRYTMETVFHSYEGDILETFLFDKRYGHCEYFATSMTMMLRAAGIPGRFVSGFSASTYNPLTGYYEVRGLNAHAWSEAWIAPYGWVMFEATPGYEVNPQHEEASPAKMIEGYLQTLENMELSNSDLFAKIREGIATVRKAFEASKEFSASNRLALLGAIAAMVAISFLWYAFSPFLWSLFANMALRHAATRYQGAQRHSRMFDIAQHHLSHYALERKVSMTFEEYAAWLASQNIETKAELSQLVVQMNRVSYGENASIDNAAQFEMMMQRFVNFKRSRRHPLMRYFSKLLSKQQKFETIPT